MRLLMFVSFEFWTCFVLMVGKEKEMLTLLVCEGGLLRAGSRRPLRTRAAQL